MRKTTFNNFEYFLKAVFHKFYLVRSWILCPVCTIDTFQPFFFFNSIYGTLSFPTNFSNSALINLISSGVVRQQPPVTERKNDSSNPWKPTYWENDYSMLMTKMLELPMQKNRQFSHSTLASSVCRNGLLNKHLLVQS